MGVPSRWGTFPRTNRNPFFAPLSPVRPLTPKGNVTYQVTLRETASRVCDADSPCDRKYFELRRMSAPAAPSKREPAVGFIFVTLVLIVLGWGIIAPVMPGLITEFEGGDASAGAHTYGWIIGVFSAMQFFGAP